MLLAVQPEFVHSAVNGGRCRDFVPCRGICPAHWGMRAPGQLSFFEWMQLAAEWMANWRRTVRVCEWDTLTCVGRSEKSVFSSTNWNGPDESPAQLGN